MSHKFLILILISQILSYKVMKNIVEDEEIGPINLGLNQGVVGSPPPKARVHVTSHNYTILTTP